MVGSDEEFLRATLPSKVTAMGNHGRVFAELQ